MARVLLIDDEPLITRHLTRMLGADTHTVRAVHDPRQAAGAAAEFQPDVVVLDLSMPGRKGLDLLPTLRSVCARAEIIIFTGAGNVANAVRAMKEGAFDFIQKPNDEALSHSIERAIEMRRLRDENAFLREHYDAQTGAAAFLAFSDKTRALLDLVARYRDSVDVPVLIEGESGTGKELIARYIHHDGSDYTRPFIAINCGAIPQALVESELFGYVPGAFTGARVQGAIGKVEAAAGGTLFLDEIGDLDPASQVKFLRFLEHGTFFPVGSHQERTVKTRIVCATNCDLDRAVEAGDFRRDLYYRINVGHVRIPPLRDRRDEIVPLAERFLSEFAERLDKPFDTIAAETQAILRKARWPGNVRELRNTIERTVLMEDGPVLLPEHVSFLRAGPAAGQGGALVLPGEAPLPEDGLDLEGTMLRLIERALELHGGNQSRTARYLGITREALRYRMQKLPRE